MSGKSTLQAYDAWIASHRQFAEQLKARIIEELDDAGLVYDQVAVRIKDRESFARKVANAALPDYKDVETAHDIVGVRVITYHSTQIPQLLEVLSDMFEVVAHVDKAAETAQKGRFGYASQHVVVRVDGQLVEIQLRTVLQHAWAEFEHDIRYKNPEWSNPQVDRAFTLAAGLIELADQQFDTIASIIGEAPGDTLDATHLPALISHCVGDEYPTSQVGFYDYAVDMLAAHGIDTREQLIQLLSPEHVSLLWNTIGYSYHPGQVRLIDDMLLFTYGREHIKKTVHMGDNVASRPGRLGARWQQLGQRTLHDLR